VERGTAARARDERTIRREDAIVRVEAVTVGE
jgi:hypothetical protein